MYENFDEELEELYRSVEAELSGEKEIHRRRLLVRGKLERMAAARVSGLSTKDRARYKRELGLMLFLSATLEPAFVEWIAWKVEKRSRALSPDEMIDEFLELLQGCISTAEKRDAIRKAKAAKKQKGGLGE